MIEVVENDTPLYDIVNQRAKSGERELGRRYHAPGNPFFSYNELPDAALEDDMPLLSHAAALNALLIG